MTHIYEQIKYCILILIFIPLYSSLCISVFISHIRLGFFMNRDCSSFISVAVTNNLTKSIFFIKEDIYFELQPQVTIQHFRKFKSGIQEAAHHTHRQKHRETNGSLLTCCLYSNSFALMWLRGKTRG